MAAKQFKQEMPPAGGFGSVIYERIHPKQFMSGYKAFGILGLITGVASYFYVIGRRISKLHKRQNHDITVALEPLLIAERDRMYLNQLRRNRDDERELMKNVPDWKVGTFYGDPLYKTIAPGRFVHPTLEEYYAHAPPGSLEEMYLFEYHD